MSSELAELIREAEKVKKKGAGISKFEHMYNRMLKELKILSSQLESYGGLRK